MAIIKCKMCGGDVELADNKTFGTCEYCGSTMTFPKVDDDQRAAAFNRGNHFRRIGEFDKALAVYERIVREDDCDAEAHWCCALCRFGIEYVEDPQTFEWLPTCHRASFDSFLEDVDYLAAVEYSDGITRRQYQKDAAKIAEVQRGILATSQNTEPYDVFICYKESDENGNRTKDSAMAQDIYYQLTEQGRKVFFARITLEDVVGTQYEPYIFAALNSAKVMIVVGTKPEHLNAVWVKNEWSRFLAMMRKDRTKLLLPCYRDMDPYDLPEQLSVLQSYDMGKIGFIQDLIRGVSKVLNAEKKPENVTTTVVEKPQILSNAATLLERGNLALEDGEWDRADTFYEQVLNQDAHCAEAYLGKLLAEAKVHKCEQLKNLTHIFWKSGNYQKLIRFGSRELVKELQEYVSVVDEYVKKDDIYKQATVMISGNRRDYRTAAKLLESIPDHKNAAQLAAECLEKAETSEKEAVYKKATAMVSGNNRDYRRAAELLNSIPDYKNAAQLAVECIERAKALENEAIYKKAKAMVVSQKKSEEALLMEKWYGIKAKNVNSLADEDYLEAARLMQSIAGYRDAEQCAQEYMETLNSLKNERQYMAALKYTYDESIEAQQKAIQMFEAIPDYKDAQRHIEFCQRRIQRSREKEMERIRSAYREKKCCQYCGGSFKGVFTKVCERCGREKDY